MRNIFSLVLIGMLCVGLTACGDRSAKKPETFAPMPDGDSPGGGQGNGGGQEVKEGG